MNKKIKKKAAFTLPEVLIVIGIIGVVAAVLMPTVIREFETRSNSYREANIANKVTQAMEIMNAAGDLHYYQTTEEFVEALKKHLKVIKVCTPDNIEECWSSKTVTTSSKGTYEVKNAKTGRDLHTGNGTNTAGLILADGAQILLTYNPEIGAAAGENITPSKKTLPVGFGKTKEFAYTTSVTNAIDFVMDVNGTSGPNAETTDDGALNDIRSFRVASFSGGPCPSSATRLADGKCILIIDNYKPLNCLNPFIDAEYKSYCQGSKEVDYISGSIKVCDDLNMKVLEYNATYFKYLNQAEIIPTTSMQNFFLSTSCWHGKDWCYNNENSQRPIICEK